MDSEKNILLHITDLHFGDNVATNYSLKKISFFDIADLILEKLDKLQPTKLTIAIGGDITNKGSSFKFQYARAFFEHLKNGLKGTKIDYIICPGNHDINRGSKDCFQDFNLFAAEITKNEEFMYTDDHSSVLFEVEPWSFITSNSSYERDPKYGEIQIDHLEEKLKLAKFPIVLLTHHHLIPIFHDDNSTIRNAYNLLKLCFQYDVKLILHGHVHSSFSLNVSDSNRAIKIIGCGAILPHLNNNYNNQFNIYELLDSGKFRFFPYSIINDSIHTHKPAAIINNNL